MCVVEVKDSHVQLVNETEKLAPTYNLAHAQKAKPLSKALGTRVYPDAVWTAKTVRKRLEHATCGRRFFESGKKIADKNIPDTCGQDLRFFVCCTCIIMKHSHLNDMEIPGTKRFIPKVVGLGATLI